MKNYLYTAVGIISTIAVAGGLTVTAGVASAFMIALVSLMRYESKKQERSFINTDKSRVKIINQKASDLFDARLENQKLREDIEIMKTAKESKAKVEKVAKVAKTKTTKTK